MRKSDQFLLAAGVLILLFILTVLDASLLNRSGRLALATMANQVKNLELTDLSLFTEARYTRHLSQSDLHTPFQDHPLAFEHFPSGSLVMPPHHIKQVSAATEHLQDN